ncbi:hypothetical protein BDR07DRAFT_1446702 [Suillus spraguei]|nr:hypothetical protein BDR07DRAFT_1446702 [Suillus spraguei]
MLASSKFFLFSLSCWYRKSPATVVLLLLTFRESLSISEEATGSHPRQLYAVNSRASASSVISVIILPTLEKFCHFHYINGETFLRVSWGNLPHNRVLTT